MIDEDGWCPLVEIENLWALEEHLSEEENPLNYEVVEQIKAAWIDDVAIAISELEDRE